MEILSCRDSTCDVSVEISEIIIFSLSLSPIILFSNCSIIWMVEEIRGLIFDKFSLVEASDVSDSESLCE